MNTVVIIGGGFSGTMTAVNLARFADQPLRVVVINDRRPFGRGTAYGTNRSEHILNVAARNMSAFPDHPDHFVEWLRTRSEFDDVPEEQLREMFVPRRIYGDYLRSLAAIYLHPADPRSKVKLEVVEDMAVDIVADEQQGGTVHLQSGDSIQAKTILLATGNQPPRPMPTNSSLTHDARYCGDPWENWLDRLPDPGGRIVLLGTGLTMVDVVITLAQVGWQGSIVGVSRSGMLPRPHFRGIAYPDFVSESPHASTLSELVALVQQQCERLQQMSQNPAIAIDKLRPHTQRLWQTLPVDQRQEFLRRYAARWNVYRHRIAQSIHERVTDALDTGQLQIVTGEIESVNAQDSGINVSVQSSDGSGTSVEGDFVINCTGPQSSFSETDLPLFQNILQRGLVRSDPLDIGIEVNQDFAVIEQDGTPSQFIFAIGPLLKGSLWETTAVPELRGQAMRVGQLILEQEPAESEPEYVIEYCI